MTVWGFSSVLVGFGHSWAAGELQSLSSELILAQEACREYGPFSQVLSATIHMRGLWVPNLPGNVSYFPTTTLWVCLSLSYTDASQQFLGAPLESWILRSSFRDLFPVDSHHSLGCDLLTLPLLFPFLVVFPLNPLWTALQASWAGGRVPILGLGAAGMVWWLCSFRMTFLGGSGTVTRRCL